MVVLEGLVALVIPGVGAAMKLISSSVDPEGPLVMPRPTSE